MNKRELRALLPPGPKVPTPVQLAWMWSRPTTALLRLRGYGPRATVRLPFQPPLVILSDPEEIRQVFAADPAVLHPGEGSVILEPMLGPNSVILLDEGAHMEQRRLLLPAFHGERIQQLAGLMVELTDTEIATWPVGEPVSLHPRLQQLTLEIVLRTVFGLERGGRLDGLRTAVTEVLAFLGHPISVVPAVHRLTPWLPVLRRFRRALHRADELIYAEVSERRRALEAGAEHGGADVLSALLEARHEDDRSAMTDQELRDELMTAVVAGHETTASQLAWAFVHIARAPHVRDRLTAEVDADEDDGYLTATIHEIQRLRPVVPTAEPRLTKRQVRIGDVDYPPGVALMPSPFLVHHDASIYPQPFTFRPERFLQASPGSYTFIPFGGGRRRCVGAAFAQLEMKIVLSGVLRRFTVDAIGRPAERTIRRSVTFSPSRGAEVILRERARNGYQSSRGPTGAGEGVRPLSAAASGAGDPAGRR